MIYLRQAQLTEIFECPYGKGPKACYQDFFALQVTDHELDELFREGWRKFGPYFFAPKCIDCLDCLPIRLVPSTVCFNQSQKRIIKKNSDVRIVEGALILRPEIFDLYAAFQKERFKKDDCEMAQFYQSFYLVPGNGVQLEYFIKDELVAVGFVDLTSVSLSSVYFFWKPEEKKRSLGIFSVLYEIAMAKKRGLQFYYLGYALEGLPSMSYKFQFKPHQIYDWTSHTWKG